MLVNQYVQVIKQAQIKSEEIKDYVDFIKNSRLDEIILDAKRIVSSKELYKGTNTRVYTIAKTIVILNHLDKNISIYPYSEKELDKVGYSIYKKFYY